MSDKTSALTVPSDVTVNTLRYRPLHRALNGAAGLVRGLGLVGDIDRDDILAAARRSTGLHDWGSDAFIPAMDRTIAEVSMSELTSLAKVFVRETFTQAVRNRLWVHDYVKRHPEVRDIEVKKPVFVLGFPRTGTTLLQNLLSLEPGRRGLEYWELTHPAPRTDDLERDARRALRHTRMLLRLAYLVAPEMQYVHAIGATTLEECWPLFFNSFQVMNFDLQSGARGYGDWLMQQDMTEAYRFYRLQLQLLQHRRPAEQLVLKCPEHLWFLDALLEVFPDACIVWTHRDPFKSVASYCSLISLAWRMLYGEIPTRRVGAHVQYRFHTGVERALDVREQVGDDRFFDVRFGELLDDPAEVIERMSRKFDLDWQIDLRQAVAGYLDNQRTDKLGAHRYDAEMWGVDRDEVHQQFARYIQAMGLKGQGQQDDQATPEPVKARRG